MERMRKQRATISTLFIVLSCLYLLSPVPPAMSSPTFPNVEASIIPLLPKIQSQQIRKRIFTHRSLAAGHSHDFQAPENDPSTDNEE